ncbi:hypothetical protein KY285_029879 [Solanum tuberosum]|nr:hypothetical protein KY285_029879 [Solanum tuberosum]
MVGERLIHALDACRVRFSCLALCVPLDRTAPAGILAINTCKFVLVALRWNHVDVQGHVFDHKRRFPPFLFRNGAKIAGKDVFPEW